MCQSKTWKMSKEFTLKFCIWAYRFLIYSNFVLSSAFFVKLTQQCLQHLFSTSFSAQDLILKHALKENVLPHNTMTNLEAIVQDIHHQHCPVSVSLLFLIILKSFPLEKYILFSGSYLPLHYLRSPLHI